MPEGRRTVVGVRFSDGELAQLDAVRGGVSRSEFCHAAALLSAEDVVPDAPVPVDRKRLAKARGASARESRDLEAWYASKDGPDLTGPVVAVRDVPDGRVASSRASGGNGRTDPAASSGGGGRGGRVQCPHRNWGRFCRPCGALVDAKGYPA